MGFLQIFGQLKYLEHLQVDQGVSQSFDAVGKRRGFPGGHGFVDPFSINKT
jgi:hypothetical protein